MNNIRALRLSHDMTQKQLAKYVRVTQQAVAKWELGACPSGYNCVRLARLFGVPVSELFSGLDSA